MVYLRTLLVTTDLSQHSLAAIEYASSTGLLYGSKIFLLYVADVDSKGAHYRSEQEATKAMNEFVEKCISPEIQLKPVVRTGSPADEVRRFAEEQEVDLIVMATHGRTGLKHMVMGSVAEKVVRLSSVPVLTVKPHAMREKILKNEDIERDLHLKTR